MENKPVQQFYTAEMTSHMQVPGWRTTCNTETCAIVFLVVFSTSWKFVQAKLSCVEDGCCLISLGRLILKPYQVVPVAMYVPRRQTTPHQLRICGKNLQYWLMHYSKWDVRERSKSLSGLEAQSYRGHNKCAMSYGNHALWKRHWLLEIIHETMQCKQLG